VTRSIESSGYVSKFAGIAFVLATLVAMVASGTPPAASAVKAIEFDTATIEFERGWGPAAGRGPKVTNIGDTLTFAATTVGPGFQIASDNCRGSTLLTGESCYAGAERALGGPPGERVAKMRFWATTGELLGEVTLTAPTLEGLVAIGFNGENADGDRLLALGSENSRATFDARDRGVLLIVKGQGPNAPRIILEFKPGPGRFFADGDRYTGLTGGPPTEPRFSLAGCRRDSTLDIERARYTDGVLTALRATFSSYCGDDTGTTVGMIAFESTPKDYGIWANRDRPVEFGLAMSLSPGSPVLLANLSSTATGALTTVVDELGDYAVEDDGCGGKPLGPYSACAVRVVPGPASELGPISGRISIRDGQKQADAAFEGTRGQVVFAYNTTQIYDAATLAAIGFDESYLEPEFSNVRSDSYADVSVGYRGGVYISAGNTSIVLRPRSGESLIPGTYTVSPEAGPGDNPTLAFRDDGRFLGCGVDASFTIHEIERDTNGNPSMLSASFSLGECGVDGIVVFNAPAPGPLLTLSVGHMTFPPDEPVQEVVWIKNVGSEPASLSISIVDDTHNAFWLVDTTCSDTLDPGESCRQIVAMEPFGKGNGPPVGALRVSDNGSYSPSLVELFGRVPQSWPTGPSAPDSFDAGYWLLQTNGSVHAFGDARDLGDADPLLISVEIVSTPTGRGYWVLDLSGEISAFGDAKSFGGLTDDDRASLEPHEFPVTMSATSSGLGYWVFTSRGRVFTFGDAPEIGDLLGFALQGAIIDSATSPGGAGAYMLGTDGGVFALGDAEWLGSVPQVLPGTVLDQPIVGIAADPDGRGYWLVAGDGGIFAFDAPFEGSVPAVLGPGDKLAAPVNGMVPYGNAYLLFASDGGAFNFSRLPFSGSLGGTGTDNVVAIAPIVVGGGIYKR